MAGLSQFEEDALKEHLSIAPNLVPLDQPGAWEARGYFDETGEPTPLGEDFITLQESGLFDPTGKLTPKGQAFALDRQEALLEQNLEAYVLRDQAGLNDGPDVSFGDALSGVGNFLWDAVKGTGRVLRQIPGPQNPTAVIPGSAEQEAEDLLARQSFAEGALESPASLGSGGAAMLEKGWAKLTGNDQAYYAAKQRHERFKSDLDDMEAGDLYGNLIDSKRAVDSLNAGRDQAVQQLGPQRSAEIERQGEASGALVGDPSNYLTAGAGALVGSAEKLPILARLSAKTEMATMAALRAEELRVQLTKARSVLDKTSRGTQAALQQADNLSALNPARADQFRSVATRLGTQADESARAIPLLEQQAADAAAQARKLAEAAGGAQKFLGTIEQVKQIGRQVRSAPARAVAPVLESIGDGLMKADSWVAANLKGLDKIRNTAAALGLATGNPMAAAPALLAAGPVVRGVGNYARILGEELMQARGSVPFWRRTAQNKLATPLSRATSHFFDFATLGGKLPTAIRNTAKGTLAAAPVDMAFEVIGSGGDMSPSTLKQGLAESLVFGGGGAFGGAMVRGNLNDLRARAAGDEINFRKTLGPEDTRKFTRMGAGPRKNLAIYAATFPNLKFKLTDSGASSFDRASNTATINVTQSDWLKPVVAHEVNHFLQVSGQMEDGIRAMLMGDGTTGGILRSKDGTLDGNFARFGEAYNKRMTDAGMPTLSPEDLAIEYFNEATVDHLVSDTDSGKLQARARRSEGERAIIKLIEATIPKVPIIRDLFIRTGGALDSKGKPVMGNGILSGGVRELPGARKMLREVMRSQAGRKATSLPDAPPASIKITSPIEQRPLIDSMFSLFETDADGKVIVDSQGVPQVITKETEKKRATAGADALKVIDKEIEAEAETVAGNPVTDPEPLDLSDPITEEEVSSETTEQKSRRVKRRENGKYEGTHFSPKALQSIRKSQKLNPEQMRNLRMLNRASRDMTGDTYLVINHPALKTSALGKKTYDAMGATERQVVPVSMSLNKKGGVFITLLSVTQLVENIKTRAESARGKKLYGGNELAIREDVEAVIALHRQGQKTDAYFSGKYGAKGPEYKNFINTVLDVVTPSQREVNPLFGEDEITDKSKGVVRTYRIDRISKAARLTGRTPLPFQYEAVKANLLPLGTPEP